MEQSIFLNSRQKEILRAFMNENKLITYKSLSEYFKLSVRTIQREVKSLAPILNRYHVKIAKKIGSGLQLQGSEANIQRLKAHLQDAQVMATYSPEERQEGIAYDLLLSNGPLKTGYFSAKFGVSAATIAYDLDKVSAAFEEIGMKVERAPGIGVYIDGTEQQRRTLLSRLLHKDITFEDWLEFFQEPAGDKILYGKLGSVIRNRLLKFVQTDKIIDVDHVLSEVLDEQSNVVLTDRNYVNLIIHIVLSMERIQSGKVIEYTNLSQWEPIESETLLLAEKIVNRLEQVFSLTFPEIEIKYISLHLAGAKVSTEMNEKDGSSEEFMWIELTQSFIRSIEYDLGTSFEGDKLLFDGLVSHFVPVLNRLKYHLQIHNPMLDKIKENYPDVFAACENACAMLTEKIGYSIPEDEVGYLTMHVGASILRIESYAKEQYKAVVVCASGLGTSMYLATKIRSEIPNLQVEAVISMNELAEWLQDDRNADIIISTVNLPVASAMDVVVVSPFLKKEDLNRIRNSLVSTIHTEKKTPAPAANVDDKKEYESASLLSLATYGEGMMHILRNFRVYEHVKVGSDRISSLLIHMENAGAVANLDILIADIKEREQQGGFILDGLAMLHTKSKGVMAPLAAVFRTEKPVPWYNDDGSKQHVQVILLLVVPADAPEEHMKMISEIPASFIEEDFLNGIINEDVHGVHRLFERVLTGAFEQRITSVAKGL
ncbi:BglG family transcription antiterminator [Lentibacillus sp. L22]|uniref:BglG family transcription antiterminator n=1 Tax=Lentibacillus TaxID=175304 RepID=UPI0022B1947D|nr:BglG family transcription antiterminator [Lentibacillus daqui]